MLTGKSVAHESDGSQIVSFPEADRDLAVQSHWFKFKGVLARIVRMMGDVAHATEEDVVEDCLKSKGNRVN